MDPASSARHSRRAVFSCCLLPLLVTLGAACAPTAPVTDVAIAPGLATFADTEAGYTFDYPADSFTVTGSPGAWVLKGRHQSWWLDVTTRENQAILPTDEALAAALRTRDADGPDGGRVAQYTGGLSRVPNDHGLYSEAVFFTEVSRHWDEDGKETTETGSLGPVYLVQLSGEGVLIMVPVSGQLDDPAWQPEEIPEIVRTVRPLPPGLTGSGRR